MGSAIPNLFSKLGRFEIRRRIGEGGMGVVYEAWDTANHARLAIKTIARRDTRSLYLFKQEFRALAQIAHPNLVALYELFAEEQQWFFTMEYIAGVDLLRHVRRGTSAYGQQESDPTATVTQALTQTIAEPGADAAAHGSRSEPAILVDHGALSACLTQLAAGVEALHRAGKLHRDIKPGNVLVTPEGRVVLLDFGLVIDLGGGPLGSSNEAPHAGTLVYMAPEQMLGLPLGPPADWYAVGVILYQALTGRAPFTGTQSQIAHAKQNDAPDAPEAISPTAPAGLSRLCLDLLQADPARRPRGPEILQRLAGALDPATGALSERPARPDDLLVGRIRQLTELQQSLEDVRNGQSVAVYVSGASGMGKSALIAHFLKEVHRLPEALILAGSCYEQEFVPYKALDGVVDGLARWLARIPEEDLPELLPADTAILARVFPVLERAAQSARGKSIDAANSQNLRRRAFTALREILRRVSERWLLCIFVDDLQWGDRDSAILLNDLLHSPGSPRLLLVGAFRSEDERDSEFLKTLLTEPPAGSPLSVRRVAVDALGPDEAAQLALDALQGDPAASERAAEIIREAAGSPYLILELTRHAGVRTAVRLDDLLWEHVEALPETARRLLEAVAISGKPVSREIVFEAADLSGGDRYALSVLRKSKLVRTGGPNEISPFHDRVRETVQARLAPEALRACHLRLAQVWERSPDADPEALAAHYRGAGDSGKAGAYYAQAAERSAATLAFDRAVEQFRLALDLRPWQPAEQRRLWMNLAEALANAGRNLDAAREYENLAAAAPEAEAMELKRRIAYYYCTAGRRTEGRAALAEVLRPLKTPLPASERAALLPLLARRAWLRVRGTEVKTAGSPPPGLLMRADVYWSAGTGLAMIDQITASYFMTRCLQVSVRAGEPYRLARALAWEAALESTRGERWRKRADILLEKCGGLLDESRQPHALGMYHLASGVRYGCSSQWAKGRREFETAARVFREQCTGAAWELGLTNYWLLAMIQTMGGFSEARVLLAQVLREAEDHGDQLTVTSLNTTLVPHLRLLDDDPAAAARALSEAMENWTKDSPQYFTAYYLRIFIDIYAGRAAEALERTRKDRWYLEFRLPVLPQMQRAQNLWAMGCCALGAADVASDPLPLARAAEKIGKRLLRDSDLPLARTFHNMLMAGVKASLGDRQAALAHARTAAAQCEELEMVVTGAMVRLRLGLLRGGGEGRETMRAAEELCREHTLRNPARIADAFMPGFARMK